MNFKCPACGKVVNYAMRYETVRKDGRIESYCLEADRNVHMRQVRRQSMAKSERRAVTFKRWAGRCKWRGVCYGVTKRLCYKTDEAPRCTAANCKEWQGLPVVKGGGK